MFQIVQVSDSLQSLLGLVLRVLLHALACNQSTTTLQNYLATQRSLVAKVTTNVYCKYHVQLNLPLLGDNLLFMLKKWMI